MVAAVYIGFHLIVLMGFVCMGYIDECRDVLETCPDYARYFITRIGHRSVNTVRTVTQPVRHDVIVPTNIIMVRNPNGDICLGKPYSMV